MEEHRALQEPQTPPTPAGPQQNVIDRNLVHKNVIEMFPDLDLTEIIHRYGHATSEQLASIIIDRMAQIPKKRGTKRKATDENDEENDRTENILLEDSYAIENDEDLGDLLIDKFLAILISKIKSELRQLNESGIGPAGFMNKRNFIMNQFNGVRVLFIEQMLDLFEHSLVPTSIACFFAENNFSGKLQKLAPGLSQNFWLKNGPPLARKRPPNMQPILAEDFPAEIYDEFGRYIQLMQNYRKGEYAELLTADLKLNQQYNLIRWERAEPEEKIECLVCYELFPLRRITYCSAPAIPKHAFLANKSVSMSKENVPEPNMDTLTPKIDKPGTSNAPKYVTPNTKMDKPGTSNAAKISYAGYTTDSINWFAFSSPTDLMLKQFNFLQNNSFANQSVSMNKENVPEPKMDKPGTSNAPNYINIPKMDSPLYTSTPYMYKKPGTSNGDNWKNWFKLEEDSTLLEEEDSNNGLLETSIIDVGEEEQNPDPSTHPFCRDCIRGQAQAATEQQPLAEGGVGLCCMVPDCKNPILYSDIRSKLSKEICKKLDERIMQENVAKALLSNLERCKRCNYAVQMEVDKNVNKVFHCLQCDAKFCRMCEQDWDDNHFGISCEELEQKLQRERKDRNLEKQLNEAVIRKCPSCGVAFMKDQGCNKMTCRCGMTMCYICRAEKIDYKHYCQHLRDPSNPNWKCKDCKKTCLLYEDAGKKDEQLIAQIRREAAADGMTNPEQEKPTTSKFRRIQIDPPSPLPYAPAPRRTHSH